MRPPADHHPVLRGTRLWWVDGELLRRYGRRVIDLATTEGLRGEEMVIWRREGARWATLASFGEEGDPIPGMIADCLSEPVWQRARLIAIDDELVLCAHTGHQGWLLRARPKGVGMPAPPPLPGTRVTGWLAGSVVLGNLLYATGRAPVQIHHAHLCLAADDTLYWEGPEGRPSAWLAAALQALKPIQSSPSSRPRRERRRHQADPITSDEVLDLHQLLAGDCRDFRGLLAPR